MKEFIEIPLSARDSELCGWEYTIPEGFVASIENGKIVVKKEEESEDERIRKEIKQHFLYLDDSFPDKAKWLAWLEKQGKKPADKVEPKFKVGDWVIYNYPDTISPISQIISIHDNIIDLKDTKGSIFQTEMEDLETNYHSASPQDVTNPAWSEEDENRFSNLVWLVNHSNENRATKEGFIKFINRLKSFKGRVQPQQKEWSEEDEENLNQLHKLIAEKAYREYEIDTDDETLYGKYATLNNWLKSLKERMKGE